MLTAKVVIEMLATNPNKRAEEEEEDQEASRHDAAAAANHANLAFQD